MESIQEEWRPVPGHDGYEVNNVGGVRSKERIVELANRWGPCSRKVPAKALRPFTHRGYLVVKLGRPNLAFGVHRLVAWAFIGPQVDGMTVNHKDGNKLNNSPSNLEYVTAVDNVLHAHRTGLTRCRGSQNGRSTLTEEDVSKIKADTTASPKSLAHRFGCREYTIRRIRNGEQWKHVKE